MTAPGDTDTKQEGGKGARRKVRGRPIMWNPKLLLARVLQKRWVVLKEDLGKGNDAER